MDINTNTRVAIKEYLPTEFATRSGELTVIPYSDDKSRYVFEHGKEKFIEEAQTLTELKNDPIVVDVLDCFMENNTAYLVMEFLDGSDLKKIAAARGGRLDPDYMMTVFLTVSSSLMEIHKKGILHRDLSPDNIFACRDGRIKLIDFGSARNYVTTQNQGMSILLKVGYAPPEQYDRKGNQGPWTDVYALCSTFYTLVSGQALVPPEIRVREESPTLKDLKAPVSDKISKIIQKGMEIDPKKRYQSFLELLNDIAAEPDPAGETGLTGTGRTGSGIKPRWLFGQRGKTKLGSTDQVEVPIRPYAALLINGEPYQSRMLEVGKELKIGRSDQQCELVIRGDINVSRVHCTLRFDGRKIYLRDQSGNGTFFAKGQERLKKEVDYPILPGTQFYLTSDDHMVIVNV